MSATHITVATALLVVLGALGFDPEEAPRVADQGFGVTAWTGKPYYQSGDTARVTFTLFNNAAEDAYGFVPVKGGNGCEYAVTVEDPAGNVVWQPGSIQNGSYTGPGCLFGALYWSLTSGTSASRQTFIPLVYQNSSGFGVLGAPLPPGPYLVCIDVYFGGPNRTYGSFAGGLSHRVCVPILIEP
jgi:hypothetical protein